MNEPQPDGIKPGNGESNTSQPAQVLRRSKPWWRRPVAIGLSLATLAGVGIRFAPDALRLFQGKNDPTTSQVLTPDATQTGRLPASFVDDYTIERLENNSRHLQILESSIQNPSNDRTFITISQTRDGKNLVTGKIDPALLDAINKQHPSTQAQLRLLINGIPTESMPLSALAEERKALGIDNTEGLVPLLATDSLVSKQDIYGHTTNNILLTPDTIDPTNPQNTVQVQLVDKDKGTIISQYNTPGNPSPKGAINAVQDLNLLSRMHPNNSSDQTTVELIALKNGTSAAMISFDADTLNGQQFDYISFIINGTRSSVISGANIRTLANQQKK